MYEILKPISSELEQFVKSLPKHSLGKTMGIHTQNALPETDNVQLAIVTVTENRGVSNNIDSVGFDEFRKNC